MPADAFDEYDGLSEEEKEIAQQFYTLGFEDGYDEGYETAFGGGSSYDDGRSLGFDEGLSAERNRIYQVCSMQMEWAEQNNKGRDYIFWKNVREILQPQNFDPMSEEEYDEWLKENA